MANLPVYTVSADASGPIEASGTVEVKDSLVAVEVSLQAIRQCVDAHLANRRQGTAQAKGRSDVRGGGAKPWRQKGTGRARAGTRSSPIWRGGGVVFGPQPRSYRQKVNKKIRRLALCSVLSDKAANERLKIVDEILVDDGRLKTLERVIHALDVAGKTLIVTDRLEPMVLRASRNRPGINVQVVDSMNVYELLNHDNLVVTKAAIEKMEAMWG